MSLKILISFIFPFALGFSVSAQQKEFELKNLTQENGLPSNESYFLYRDSKNFLWIATDQGVVRYNGNKMEYFDLPDNVVFKIREDSKGRVWFFSHTGKLAYFFNNAIYPYRYNKHITNQIKNILITDAYVNDNDDIIINSGVGENYKILKSGAIEKYNYLGSDAKGKNAFRIAQINDSLFFAQEKIVERDQSDTITIQVMAENRDITYKIPWVARHALQYGCVTTNKKEIIFFNGKGMARLNSDGSFKTKYFPHIITSLTALDNQIWVGFMKNGAVLLDAELNEVYKEKILRDKSVTSIRSDYEGGLWFSTLEKGVFYLKNSRINHLTGDSTLAGPVFRLCNSGDGNVLFANAKGVYKLTHNSILPVVHQNSTKITDLFVDGTKNIFLSGACEFEKNIGAMYKKGSNFFYKNIFILTAYSEVLNPQKNKYLVSNYNGFLQYTLGQGTIKPEGTRELHPDALVHTPKPGVLYFDTRKQIWMGTINALYKLNSINSPQVKFKPYDTLFQKGITDIRQMENGIYCIGIRFGGIVLMQDTTVIARISDREGLLNNSIKYMLPLKNQLWAANAKGISVINFQSYNPVKYTITNIGKNDGIYNLTIYQLMQYQGNILAATSNGIYEIDYPEKFLGNMPKPIPFYINSISYYKGDTGRVSSITVPFNNNRVVIKYGAVCFNLPEEIKYYYRFDNVDTSWHEIASTELVMENLIPGTYNLEIRAAIHGEKRFSEVQKLQILIEKPWWQNNLLQIFTVIVLLATGLLFFKRRIDIVTSREQQNIALNTKMMELEQTALRSQMNPHFIFNCLTSIQQLVVTGNKTEANEYLVKFARLIRKTLELSGRSFITIEEETNYLKEYLELEQLRIPGQFEFFINTDANVNAQKTEIPNMMFQPIVENCIRHGIKHLNNKKGYITISLKQEEKYIYCSITDNGVGRVKFGDTGSNTFTKNKSYGMDIVNKRLQTLSAFDDTKESMLEVEDLYHPDGSAAGTKVTMRLPFKTI